MLGWLCLFRVRSPFGVVSFFELLTRRVQARVRFLHLHFLLFFEASDDLVDGGILFIFLLPINPKFVELTIIAMLE